MSITLQARPSLKTSNSSSRVGCRGTLLRLKLHSKTVPGPVAYSKGPLFSPGKTESGKRKTGRCNEVLWARLPSKARRGRPGEATLCGLERTFPLAGWTWMEHCSIAVLLHTSVRTGMASQPGQANPRARFLATRVKTRALTGRSQKGCP